MATFLANRTYQWRCFRQRCIGWDGVQSTDENINLMSKSGNHGGMWDVTWIIKEEGNFRNRALRGKDIKAGRQEGSLRKPCSNSGRAAQRFSPGISNTQEKRDFLARGISGSRLNAWRGGSRLGSSLVSVRKVKMPPREKRSRVAQGHCQPLECLTLSTPGQSKWIWRRGKIKECHSRKESI